MYDRKGAKGKWRQKGRGKARDRVLVLRFVLIAETWVQLCFAFAACLSLGLSLYVIAIQPSPCSKNKKPQISHKRKVVIEFCHTDNSR